MLQAPTNINCDAITGYTTRYPTFNEGVEETTATSRVVTVDGDMSLEFFVSAQNSQNVTSAVTSQTVKSPYLRKSNWTQLHDDVSRNQSMVLINSINFASFTFSQ